MHASASCNGQSTGNASCAMWSSFCWRNFNSWLSKVSNSSADSFWTIFILSLFWLSLKYIYLSKFCVPIIIMVALTGKCASFNFPNFYLNFVSLIFVLVNLFPLSVLNFWSILLLFFFTLLLLIYFNSFFSNFFCFVLFCSLSDSYLI